MKKQKTQKNNKGITLIALVITIIVMLILVAVTISMAVNGGLFEYARNAGEQTNGAVANEQNLANLEEGMTVNDLIDKYTQNSNGENVVCEECTDGYVIIYEGPNETRIPCPNCSITFYYNDTEYTVARGDKWNDFVGKAFDSIVCDGFVMGYLGNYFVCYEDGTWVSKDDLIVDGYHYTKRFSI